MRCGAMAWQGATLVLPSVLVAPAWLFAHFPHGGFLKALQA